MQKKFLLPLLALLFMAGGECFASKVIYKAGVSGKTVAFNFPASCVGASGIHLGCRIQTR